MDKTNSKTRFTDQLQIVNSNIGEFEIKQLIKEHLSGLACPIDSWLEDNLFDSDIHSLKHKNQPIGYAGPAGKVLQFFYIRPLYFRHAPDILEKLAREKAIKRVLVMTQDSLLCALIAEWDYEKVMQACWFSDSGRDEVPGEMLPGTHFRTAALADISTIRKAAGGDFKNLEERIEAETIFILEADPGAESETDLEADLDAELNPGQVLLGCGIIEKSKIFMMSHRLACLSTGSPPKRGSVDDSACSEEADH
ncbi:MAG TPA: hypothetical protein VLH18_09080 [Candidatus Limnocylindrales bacterium]|nr:hypothetical protein [Candidatus Limnocylindrales bacterium]